MKRILARLHRDEHGQIVPMFILGLVSLVMLIVMLLNTGQNIVNRTEVQNAADAAAITQASWTARSLNVMAMNNVALTQAFAVSVVSAVLNATAIELEGHASLRLVEYGEKASAPCAACLATGGLSCIPCGWYVFKAEKIIEKVMWPTGKIIDENFSLPSRFGNLAIAFSDMNDHIASSFPDFTDGIQRGIADENDVDPPLFYPPAPSRGSNLSATPLPVEDSDPLLDVFPILTTKLPPKWRLCSAGEYGTHGLPLGIIDYFENFIEHGYQRDEGPYTIARNNADQRISKPLEAIAGWLHRHPRYRGEQQRGNNEFTRTLEPLWQTMCSLRWRPSGEIPIPPPPSLSLYRITVRPNPPYPDTRSQETRDGLSLVAFTRRRARAAVVPGRFANPPSATYAYAQAEVYTEQAAHDLFTQDWRARLVPAKLLERRRNEVVRAVEEFSTLHELFGSLSPDELRRVNAH